MHVILAHGLGRSRLSMLLLGRRLARAGHLPTYFSYSSLSESYSAIISRMIAVLHDHEGAGHEVGLIGHSFGGLLFRAALPKVPRLKVKHLVMLGTPNRPPRLAPKFYSRQPLKLLRSELGQLLANKQWYSTLPKIDVPYTIVSGTKGWRCRLSPFHRELNDAIVSVSETILSESDKPVLVSSLHTFLMNKREVSALVLKLLGSRGNNVQKQPFQ